MAEKRGREVAGSAMKLWYVSTADTEAYAFAEDVDGAVAQVPGAAGSEVLCGEVEPLKTVEVVGVKDGEPLYFAPGGMGMPYIGTPSEPLLLYICHLDTGPHT